MNRNHPITSNLSIIVLSLYQPNIFFEIQAFNSTSTMSQPLRDYLPGFASLLEQIDRKVLVLLRDGRSLFGILRSIDQFANLVLHLTVERIYIGNEYGEIDRGVFLIRGENVVLCGEVDEDEEEQLQGFTRVPIEVILASQARDAEEKSNRDKFKVQALKERGMLIHGDGLADDI